jgi:catechol-2,3-dioxygenase
MSSTVRAPPKDNGSMRAQLEKVVLDCPDPRALAAFYATVLGMHVLEDGDDWVVIGREPGMRELAVQRADP